MTSRARTGLPKRANILGVGLSLLDQKQLLEFICHTVSTQGKALILSGNIYSFNLAYENEWLRKCLNQADVVRLDGTGVGLGAQLLGYDAPQRMTWADFAWNLSKTAEKHGHSMFLLGGRSGVATKAANLLKERHPELNIVGTHHGYFDKTSGHVENETILKSINIHSPDILIVGLGMPLQERWLLENRERINAKVVMTGGAVFDYISGELRRGPRWMTDNGMEWLARLLIEPRRLWQRYLIGNPLFMWRIFKQKFGIDNY